MIRVGYKRFVIYFHSSKYIYFRSSRIQNLNVAIFTGLHNYLFYGDGTNNSNQFLCISDVTDVFDVSIPPTV